MFLKDIVFNAKARHPRTATWLHLDAEPREDKFPEMESRITIAKGRGEEHK